MRSHILIGAACLIAAVATGTACHRPCESFLYDENGMPQSIKRIERNMTRQFTAHWSRTAYHRPSVKKLAKPGSPQEVILEQWGAPDWVRNYRSIQNEPIQEWLYMSKMRLFQFNDRELVFDGPVTDLEQILLNRGYPDRIEYTRNNVDSREYQLFYIGIFRQNIEQFNLFNDKIVTSIEGN